MGVSLSKGEVVVLAKVAPTLNKVVVGLGWDAVTSGQPFDADASVFLLAGGKVQSDEGMIFYGHKQSTDGSVVHMGDNRTGEGEGDDEQIKIDLSAVPAEIDSIPVVVTIYEFAARGQSFANVSNAFVRLVNEDTGEEIARYDLAGFGAETGLVFGRLDRQSDGWQFTAVGQPAAGGLQGIATSYGVNVG